ncbi:MAG: nitroreductase [Hyphomicrobiaceae bacterium]|nr:nitroreductase [Hyphomicrobiaceae bacterium]
MAGDSEIGSPPARPMTVEQAISGRWSARAFLPTPVPRETIARILLTAGHAPSGSNIQPWKVWVLMDEVKTALSNELLALFHETGEGKREYDYYPKVWREPYLKRRRACGWGLYSTLGISRDDKAGMKAQRAQNYAMFGAPACFIFTIDRDMELGSWLDYGMFLQSIMIAAREHGLETCSQAALANYSAVLHRRLRIPEEQMVVCGMAIGFADTNAKVNTFRTGRMALDEFVTWVDELAD